MSNDKVVAYIDMLGFSNFVFDDQGGALGNLTASQAILRTKLRDDLLSPVENYPDLLKSLASKHSLDSVTDFIPFSDSIFMISEKPDVFINQISSFLIQCFNFQSEAFRKEYDEESPYKAITFDTEGNIEGVKIFPVLFRGGVSYGEAFPIKLLGKSDSKPHEFVTIYGKAVVNAVKMEGKLKGPRLIIDESLYAVLNHESKKIVVEIQSSDEVKLYQVLWTSVQYIMANGKNEIYKFSELFVPAVNLWKYHKDKPSEKYYFDFMKLIIEGTLRVFSQQHLRFEAYQHIEKVLNELSLVQEKNSLLGSL